MMSVLDKLDTYLSSDDSPDDCMMLSDLDGFLHGVACSPVPIPIEEWMAVAVGGDPGDLPKWVLEEISVIFFSIVEGLASDPAEVEPIFWEAPEGHVIAMDWCEGYRECTWRPIHRADHGSSAGRERELSDGDSARGPGSNPGRGSGAHPRGRGSDTPILVSESTKCALVR